MTHQFMGFFFTYIRDDFQKYTKELRHNRKGITDMIYPVLSEKLPPPIIYLARQCTR